MDRQKVLKALQEFIYEERAQRIHEVASLRTRMIKVVIEDIFQDRNAGAVFRTCDCFGIQEVGVIENRYNSRVAKNISKGSEKWLDIYKYGQAETDNTLACIANLRSRGYTVIATSPHEADISLDSYKLNGKTAILFGTEEEGLSQTALEQADHRMAIPIYGFTESFNISVSAALVLQKFISQLHQSNLPWKLRPEDQLELEILWTCKTLGNSGQAILQKVENELNA